MQPQTHNPLTSIARCLRAFGFGLMLSASLGLVSAPQAVADDIDIYTQPAPSNQGMPLVVLGLDLNLDPTDIVCSDVLADPSTLPDQPLCDTLQKTVALPVLEQSLGLQIGGLLDSLLGESSGLLGLVGDISGITLTDLANTLRGITGDSGSGSTVPLDQLDVARLLLYRVMHQLIGVRVAVMVNNANTCTPDQFTTPRHNTHGCSNGAFFLLGATELLESNVDDTVDDVLQRIGQIDVTTLDPDSDPTPPYQGKEVYYELLRYLTDGKIYNANLDADNGLPLTPAPDVAPGNNGVDYISPLDASTCEDIYMVNILFTDSQGDDDSDADMLADPHLAGANADGGDFTWPEMIRFLADTGFEYGGGTYHLKSSFMVNGPGAGAGDLLSNLVGTTMSLPLALNPLAVNFTSHDTFEPVRATSATFGGPQTVFSRTDIGSLHNDLYTGLFRPDPDRKPAWRGNVKKLKLTEAGDTIIDALDQPAIAPDGNIADTALTFWTDASGLPDNVDNALNGRDGRTVDRGGAGMFLLPPYTPPTPANPTNVSGSGSLGPRIFYQSAGAGLPVAPLNLDGATVDDAQPALEADDKLEAAELVAWARGYETDPSVLGDEGYGGFLGFLDGLVSGITDLIKDLVRNLFNSLFCDPILGLLGSILGYSCHVPPAQEPPAQPWLMGDVLHSDPLAIDYGRTATTGDGETTVESDIRIFAGTNRGFLHEFRDAALPGDSTSFGGQEVWRFSPRAVMDDYKQWRSQSPTAASRPYGVDGAAVAWVKDIDGVVNADDGDHVYLYFGLRRGGHDYYGLDVTDPDAAPTGLWHISQTSGADSDFAELGLTFSTPRLGRIRITDDNGILQDRTVLVFGGGYDGGYDSAGNALGKDAERGSDSVLGTDDSVGNALFVVDAETGALIWKARHGSSIGETTVNGHPVWQHPELTDGIPSDVTALDTTGDGYLDRLYVGDTGGRIWRADIGGSDPASWKAAPIASLGRHAHANVTHDRRFFERPDVLRVKNGSDSFMAIVIGSGNRADPLNSNTHNELYVLKDSAGTVDPEASPIVRDNLADFTGNCSSTSCASLLDSEFTASGWRMRLGGANSSGALLREGEKALSSPLTIGGKVLFTSYVPPDPSVSACTPQEGSGRLYAIDIRTAQGVVPLFAQDGEPGPDVSIDYARATPMAAAGIPAGVSYLRPQHFLTSDFGLTDLTHRSSWRTYWRERTGD